MLVFTAIYTSQDNSVSRLGHGLYDRGVMVQVLAEVNGISLHYIHTTFLAHPASYAGGLWALSPGVIWPGHEVAHSSPCNAKVKNVWNC